MICKFAIKLCYVSLGEFMIRGREDLLETLLKQQWLSSTHTIWTIKFEICGSKHHALSEFLPGEGLQLRYASSIVLHSCQKRICRHLFLFRGLPKSSFFSEQEVCKEYELKRLRQYSSRSLQLSLMQIKVAFVVLKTFSRAGFPLSAITLKVEMTLTIQFLTTSLL